MKNRLKRLSVVSAFMLMWAAMAPSQAQMTMAGQFSVGPSGAATYTIPIQVPPGMAGIEPKLALTYNSQGGSSLLGLGWSLSGLSTIRRCPKTRMQDGPAGIGAVGYDLKDRYCLDGQRLIAVSGLDGGAGTEYRTEQDGFGKIISYAEAGATSGPGSFMVKTKSGLTMEYGKTADSRIEAQGKTAVAIWALNKVIDAKGNFYTVSYSEDNASGQYYPVGIKYTGNAAAGLAVSHEVIFVYESKNDVGIYYLGGAFSKSNVRLTHIKTLSGSVLVKDYSITYELASQNRRSAISNVLECTASGACLPATTVQWQKGADVYLNGKNSVVSGTFTPASTDSGKDTGVLADVNGDGLADYVVAWSNYGQRAIRSYIAKADGSFATWVDSYVDGTFVSLGSDSNQDIGRLVDVNGDGMMDYVVVWNYNGGRAITSYLGKGDGTFFNSVWGVVDGTFIPASSGSNQDVGTFIDVNGDGLLDYVVVWSNGGGRAIAAYLGKGNGTFFNSVNCVVDGTFVPTGSGSNQDIGTFIDVNGDGVPDYVIVWNYNGGRAITSYLGKGDGTFSNSVWGVVDGNFIPASTGSNHDAGTFVDANGDGLPDYLVVWNYNGGRAVTTYLGKGNGLFANSVWGMVDGTFVSTAAGSNVDIGNFIDVNGDGLIDYVVVWNNGGGRAITVYLGKGDGTFSNSAWGMVDGTFIPAESGSSQDAGTFVDLNGDGLPDYVVPWSNGGARNLAVYLRSGSPIGLVSEIGNGIVGGSKLAYAALSNTYGVRYAKSLTSIFPRMVVSPSWSVVTDVDFSSGVGGLRRVSYWYDSAVVELGISGRGLLGFQWMQSKDVSTGVVSRTYYRQDFPYIGMVDKVGRGTSEANWSNLGLSTNEYKFMAFVASDAGYASGVTCSDDPVTGKTVASCATSAIKPLSRYVPYVAKMVSKAWDWDSTTNVFTALPQSRTSTVLDSWGNATQVKAETLNADGTDSGYSKTTNSVFAPADTANWRLGRLLKSSVTAAAP